MRWKTITADGVMWAWDTKSDKIYKFNKDAGVGSFVDIGIQQLSKFVPYMGLSGESDTKPDWVDDRSPEELRARLMGH
ncbi:MAG: hypothetical protein GY916_01845 [Gammaproteobacteria bacterium]|nr:hypothetical protein [Gammaproteobacteria bacterium]